ncbi:MAG TPA: hypothetical protein VMR98_02360, partial [Candidatus Polarisedimenticolaceae bacterium]|nr:hypothetical protein [Candidatus Polarisedimenticolaceae bacterium]
ARRFPNIKVVAVSNIDTPRVMKEAKELGATRYIIKVDTTPKEIVAMVKKLTQPQELDHEA